MLLGQTPGPPVIEGLSDELTVTVNGPAEAWQPLLSVTITEYVPAPTVIESAVAPVLHKTLA